MKCNRYDFIETLLYCFEDEEIERTFQVTADELLYGTWNDLLESVYQNFPKWIEMIEA